MFVLHTGGSRTQLLIQFRFRRQASDAGLELAVLGGVDERVDAAVGEHQRHGEVVEPAGKVDRVAGEIEKERDGIR